MKGYGIKTSPAKMLSKTKASIEIIKAGQPLRVGELLIGLLNSGTLIVTGWTEYNYLESLTKSAALQEMMTVKQDFQNLISSRTEWAEFSAGRTVQYNLMYDSGKAGEGICKEIEETIIWQIDLEH